MHNYIVMQNADDTICLESQSNNLIKCCQHNGYKIIGRVKCRKSAIDSESIGIQKGSGQKNNNYTEREVN